MTRESRVCVCLGAFGCVLVRVYVCADLEACARELSPPRPDACAQEERAFRSRHALRAPARREKGPWRPRARTLLPARRNSVTALRLGQPSTMIIRSLVVPKPTCDQHRAVFLGGGAEK